MSTAASKRLLRDYFSDQVAQPLVRRADNVRRRDQMDLFDEKGKRVGSVTVAEWEAEQIRSRTSRRGRLTRNWR